MGTMLERARAVTPGGSQTRSKAPGRVGPADLPEEFPLFAVRGLGPYLWDDRGRRFLDFAGANAAVPLGYGHPEVTDAVAQAVGSGSLLSLPTEDEVEVSELFCDAVGVDMVRWVKTGSEAVAAAVRLARCATGASAVLVGEHSYHGWHDWTLARFNDGLVQGSHAFVNGVPSALGPTVLRYDYAHPESVGRAVERAHGYGLRVAAVLVEPHRLWEQQAPLMQACRDAADRAGAVMVVDEMVYGFRWAVGGGQEYWGVRGDLGCWGKALGNGVPVACVAGRRDLMALCATRAFVSGTFGGDRLGLGAARAVLRAYRREDVLGRLWDRGRAFWEGVREGAGVSDPGLFPLEGFPVHFAVRWASRRQMDWVLARMARQGVLLHRDANNASAAMSREDATGAGRLLGEAFREAEAQGI